MEKDDGMVCEYIQSGSCPFPIRKSSLSWGVFKALPTGLQLTSKANGWSGLRHAEVCGTCLVRFVESVSLHDCLFCIIPFQVVQAIRNQSLLNAALLLCFSGGESSREMEKGGFFCVRPLQKISSLQRSCVINAVMMSFIVKTPDVTEEIEITHMHDLMMILFWYSIDTSVFLLTVFCRICSSLNSKVRKK